MGLLFCFEKGVEVSAASTLLLGVTQHAPLTKVNRVHEKEFMSRSRY